ncbi:hypothetical protein [Nocardia sp. NPDC003345]
MPADAAAEHTASGSETTKKTAGDDAAESGSTDTADATEKIEKPAADPDATVKAGSDVTEKIDSDATAAAPESDGGDDATVTLGKSGTADKDADAATASESGDKDETAADDEAGKSETAGRRFPVPALAGFAVLLVAAVVAVGVFFFLAGDRQEELDRRAAATKAACDFGNSFATYSGDKADDYISRLDQGATGEWKKLVSEIGPELKTRFAETKVNSTAAEVQCGYESGSDDNARVVLVIDQQFTTASAQPQQPPGRVKVAANVDMEKIDGTWLVAKFDTPMMQQ